MATFVYRILPPRKKFWDTIELGEVALLTRYLDRLQELRDGTVRFVGRASNGDHAMMLVEAEDEAQANTIARSDPAVSEGLMRIERHTFLVVLEGAKAAHSAASRTSMMSIAAVRRARAAQAISEADECGGVVRMQGGPGPSGVGRSREGGGRSMSETAKLDLCAREPIHVPGSIQPHGLLVVLDADTGLVLQTAGDPKVMLGTEDPLPGAGLANVLEGRLEALLRENGHRLGSAPVYLGDLQASPQHPALTVTAHRVGDRDVIEIEPAGPGSPAPAMLSFVRASIERMNRATGLEDACRSIAADVRQLTGFDRVMVYRFLEDASGSVIAEQKRDNLPTFLHHRYPASDIPPQARELYRRNPIRVIPDVDYVPAPLTPALVLGAGPGAGPALDMSHCSLRSVSPAHVQYLRNMGVGASMSVSILRKGELWGLIACHHGGPRLVPFEVREVCQHLGQALSHHIEAREDAEEYGQGLALGQARDRIFTNLAAVSDLKAFLRERISDIQALIPAHGVVACVADEAASSGHVPYVDELAGLAEWVIHAAQPSGVFATDCLSEHYAPAGDFTAEGSGLLAVVLPGARPVVVMWFRAEQVEEVLWAGNPHEAVQPDASDGSPSPRRSFALWAETIHGRAPPWSCVEVEAAHLLRARAALVL